MNKLANKVAVVIGGNTGIGGAISKRFAAEGARVYATSRTALNDAEQTSSNTKEGCIHAIRADAGNPEDLGHALASIHSAEGRIDSIVVNAGISEFAPLDMVSEEHFEQIFGLNVRSLLFAVQKAVDLMQPGSTIVLIGSVAASKGHSGYGVYSASKAAVRSFTRTWASEVAPKGIRVNVVSPGPTDTAMFDAVSDEIRNAVISTIPLARLGRPEEVAAAALFLASDESSFTTGTELYVDGGLAQV